MTYTKAENTYLIKIERGENVLETLTQFCNTEKISNATLSGIGAVEWVRCGYYSLPEKRYYFKEYDEMVEVVSMTGNVFLKEGNPFLHVHAVFTDTTNVAFGGHVEEMRVGVTLEVVLTTYDTSVERKHDADIGLYLCNHLDTEG